MENKQNKPTVNPRELHLVVKTRDGVTYDGKVRSVTTSNDKGTFNILPMHANFISLVNSVVTVEGDKDTKKEIEVQNGIIKVRENYIEIFVGIKSDTPKAQ